ncbi:MAG TPA: hypothetical protein VI078_06485 [bacterium]
MTDRRTRNVRRRGGIAVCCGVLCALAAAALPAAAQNIQTNIDMNYTYEQEHTGNDVLAIAGFQQKYQVRLGTTLTSSLDFLGALTLDLDDKAGTAVATTAKASPSLELGVLGPQSSAKFTYTSIVNKTREFEDASASTMNSNTAVVDLDLTPGYWPEVKFKLQEQRDYELETTETSNRTMELQLRDDIFDVLLEFSLKLGSKRDRLPERQTDKDTEWSLKGTYKTQILSDVDFEAAYELKETYSEVEKRGVPGLPEEEYTQSLKTRLQKSLELTPRLRGDLTWEYTFDQDLLKLDYEYQVTNKFDLEVRYDVLPNLKVAASAKRDTEMQESIPGEDDTAKVTDTLNGAFDFEPVNWLRIGGKGELKYEDEVAEDTGRSIDTNDDRKYEFTLKNRFRDVWDLTAGTSATWSYTDGILDAREAKFKSVLRLRVLKFTWAELLLTPSYESSHKSTWDDLGLPSGDTSTANAKFKLEFKSLVLGYLRTTISHEYGRKTTRETDEVLNYEEEVGFNEDTRLNLAITEFFEGLSLEGELERKADDTEGDAEEMVVVVSYALKLDWKYEDFVLSSAFKYNDRSSEEDDDLEFTTKVGWKNDNMDISGDYQFLKTYSDLTDEHRKLNLKLSWKF